MTNSRYGSRFAYRWCSALFVLGVTGCSMLSGVVQLVKSEDQLASEYGVIALSPPIALPLKKTESILESTVQTIKFDTALERSAAFQSAGYRRYQDRIQSGVRISTDMLKAQQLANAMLAGQSPPEGSTAAPTFPTTTILTADSAFTAGATGAAPALEVPFGRRILTAYQNTLLARLNSAQLALATSQGEWEPYVVFSTLTIVPGEKTELDASAEARVLWTSTPNGPPAAPVGQQPAPAATAKPMLDNIRVIPLFPTYESVNEFNDAASLREVVSYMTAVAQYGPAQAQGDSQRLTNDVQRRVSATERVTFVGAAVSEDTVQYRVRGVRTARPFDELRPRGTTKIEPIVLPTATLVMVRRKAIKESAQIVGIKYAGRWRRDRPWWDHLPPGTIFPGFWFDRGTAFDPPVLGGITKYFGYIWGDFNNREFVDRTRSAGSYATVAEIPLNQNNRPKPFTFCANEFTLRSPLDQTISVRAIGDDPLSFFLDGVPLEGRKAGSARAIDGGRPISPSRLTEDATPAPCSPEETANYMVFLSADALRNLGKAYGVSARDQRETPGRGTRNATALLTAINPAGASTNAISVRLAFDTFYPAPSVPERLRIKRIGGKPVEIERTRGEQWPAEAYAEPAPKK